MTHHKKILTPHKITNFAAKRNFMKSVVRLAVWLVMLGGGIWGGLVLDRRWFPALHHSLWFHLISFIIGFVLLKLVMTVSRNTGRTLAKYGREGSLPRLETNRLVTQGVYGYMRHPMHLGLLFFPFAFAFLAGSLSFILFIAPAELVFMLIMIKRVEEPEALRKFGEAYRDYMRHTPAFCLKKECLKALFQTVSKEPEEK
jgi:protein-S-isoprenylcysteine O-methyltransferase Ste14